MLRGLAWVLPLVLVSACGYVSAGGVSGETSDPDGRGVTGLLSGSGVPLIGSPGVELGGGGGGGGAPASALPGLPTPTPFGTPSPPGSASPGLPSSSPGTADLALLTALARTNELEAEAARAALQNSASSGVLGYAAAVVRDNATVAQLLGQVPELTVDQQLQLATLQEQRDAAFDRAYLQASVSNGQAALALLQGGTGGVAAQVLPFVQSHLQAARQLLGQL